jgi:cyclopropane fatty-acyl-phospholipid synthase-like methyltransferase
MARRRSRNKTGSGKTQAQLADVHQLYEEAVQDPEGDVAIVRRIFKKRYGRDPHTLREDFCGTAAMACAWVRAQPENAAWGVDLDPEPLCWGRERHVAKLSDDQRKRITLLEGDVRDVTHEKVDVTVAFNFSYFVFQERADLIEYFRKVRSTLLENGLFVVDLYGGAEAQRTLTETREHEDFDYVWDQDEFDPIHHHAMNYIHFEFPDGSRIDRAFTYDWRLWTIPEIREAMRDAGFSETEAYWERTDQKTNEGTGVYYRTERAADDPAWVAYVVGIP